MYELIIFKWSAERRPEKKNQFRDWAWRDLKFVFGCTKAELSALESVHASEEIVNSISLIRFWFKIESFIFGQFIDMRKEKVKIRNNYDICSVRFETNRSIYSITLAVSQLWFSIAIVFFFIWLLCHLFYLCVETFTIRRRLRTLLSFRPKMSVFITIKHYYR